MPPLLIPKETDLQSVPALLAPALTHSSGGWTRTNGGLYLGNGLTIRPLLPTRVLQNILAGPARLELAISDVTGRRSDQLNYGPNVMPAPGAAPGFSDFQSGPITGFGLAGWRPGRNQEGI